MTEIAPVKDWATDFDVLDPRYVKDPFSIWDDLRGTCPIAHTNRRKSSWLPTRYEDVTAIAHDIEHFSSNKVAVIPGDEDEDPNADFDGPNLEYGLPPISSDPPLHTWTRRLLLPWFSHKRVDGYVPMTRGLCTKLLDGFADSGQADAATDYAQQIPVRVIAHILGVSPDLSDTFTLWVRDILEFADDAERRQRGAEGLLYYFVGQLEERRANPGDDLLSELLTTEVDGKPVDDGIVLGMAALALIAGVDTTWSAIGSSLWHLATHPEDRKRLVAEPELMPTAIEELLRAYSPVTMAREVTEDVVYAGCPMKAGDKVLMNFPAANRDPEAFEHPEVVQLDRAHNRHVAFGSGIHRCAGSNLARMELQVALEEWLARIPDFSLAEGAEVTWAGGQVRGPRICPVVFR
ncbi:MAG: cytochrome P450 [Acidimicrobiales bacterium]